MRLLPAGGSGELAPGSPEEPEATPLAWTPMRGSAMTPQAGRPLGFGLKRLREGEGTPGTPLLAAGHASEAARRIRQRGDQVSCRFSPRLVLSMFPRLKIPDVVNAGVLFSNVCA